MSESVNQVMSIERWVSSKFCEKTTQNQILG